MHRFLDEEATPEVRTLLCGAMDEAATDKEIEIREFSFNVFDVRLDFASNLATVFDVLALDSQTTVPMPEFAALVR